MLRLESDVTHPIICRQRSSFSIRVEQEVGTRCFRANLSSGQPFRLDRNTELKVPGVQVGKEMKEASVREREREVCRTMYIYTQPMGRYKYT